MTTNKKLVAPWVRRFLLEHLVADLNLSRNTQASYRDTLTLLLALTACNSIKPEATSNLGARQMQMAKQFKSQKTQTFKINYLLFLPQGYEAKSEKRWPLILPNAYTRAKAKCKSAYQPGQAQRSAGKRFRRPSGVSNTAGRPSQKRRS